jgi:hypothetical protein
MLDIIEVGKVIQGLMESRAVFDGSFEALLCQLQSPSLSVTVASPIVLDCMNSSDEGGLILAW